MSVSSIQTAAYIYLIFMAFVCGACAGSFVNCAALRTVQGESFLRGRSHCPHCGHTLRIWDLFPLVSWLALKGRCRYCGAHVPARYPLTELIAGLAFGAAAARFGFSFRTLQLCLLFALLLALALIDLDTMELPGILLLLAAILWAVFLPLQEDVLHTALQGVLGAGALGIGLLLITLLLDKLLKRESMGGGDIKLFAVLGLYLGPVQGLLLVLLSCILGLVFGLRPAVRGKPFPFGPSIAAAAVPVLLFGEQIADWYRSLFPGV